MPSDSDLEILWKAGRLKYQFDSNQREIYDNYRGWKKACLAQRQRGEDFEGVHPRVYVLDLSRRVGKDRFCLTVRIEDAIRKPGSILTYGTAFASDIRGIVLPLFEQITADCPRHLKPKFVGASRTGEAGIHFPNKSIIRLVGIDRNLDGLRGRHSDGVTISEAGFVDYLEDAIVSVLMPQLLGFPDADILLNSTPPQVPNFYDNEIVPDAVMRGAYVKKTLLDCPRYSDSEKEEFIRAAGGRTAEKCRREYFCERIRSESRVVVPEFDENRHVKASPMPEYAFGITALDPGVSDMTAVLVGYFDFERQKLVIRGDWGRTGATTQELHAAMTALEAKHFAGLPFWSEADAKAKPNPYSRVSDTDLRLITDFRKMFGTAINPADKQGSDAALAALRNAFLRDQIEVHPDAKLTIAHLKNAVWNKARTSYERNSTFGHYDAVDALKYLFRHVDMVRNPNPSEAHRMVLSGADINGLHFPKNRQELRPNNDFESLLPSRRR